MKIQLLIESKILKNNDFFLQKHSDDVFILLTIILYQQLLAFNAYEQNQFHAQLS